MLLDLTGPLPAVRFCRAPQQASWVLLLLDESSRDRYMSIALVWHNQFTPDAVLCSGTAWTKIYREREGRRLKAGL